MTISQLIKLLNIAKDHVGDVEVHYEADAGIAPVLDVDWETYKDCVVLSDYYNDIMPGD